MGAATRLERARQEVLDAVQEHRQAAGTGLLPARAKVEVKLSEFEKLVKDTALIDATEAVEQLREEMP